MFRMTAVFDVCLERTKAMRACIPEMRGAGMQLSLDASLKTLALTMQRKLKQPALFVRWLLQPATAVASLGRDFPWE